MLVVEGTFRLPAEAKKSVKAETFFAVNHPQAHFLGD